MSGERNLSPKMKPLEGAMLKVPWHPIPCYAPPHPCPTREAGLGLPSLISAHLVGSKATPGDLGNSLEAWHKHQLGRGVWGPSLLLCVPRRVAPLLWAPMSASAEPLWGCEYGN